jgi:hypothetical protein
MVYFDVIVQKLNFKSPSFVVIFDELGAINIGEKILSEYNFFINEYPEKAKADFMLAFVTERSQLDEMACAFSSRTEGDAVLWIAYPKSSSKRFQCDFNRDTGWETFGNYGFESVRQVSIDHDWSAIRLRRVQYIRKMTRSFALSNLGKQKVTGTHSTTKPLESPEDLIRILTMYPATAGYFEALPPSPRKECIG